MNKVFAVHKVVGNKQTPHPDAISIVYEEGQVDVLCRGQCEQCVYGRPRHDKSQAVRRI